MLEKFEELKAENESLKKSLDEKGEALEKASQTIEQFGSASQGRKSVDGLQFSQRFNEIQKSEDGERDVYEMSNPAHRSKLKAELMKRSDIEKSDDAKSFASNVAQNLELVGNVDDPNGHSYQNTVAQLGSMGIEIR